MLFLHLSHMEDADLDHHFNMLNLIKALRWLCKLTEFSFPDLYNPIISCWTYSEHQFKESVPSQLFFLIACESDVVQAEGSLQHLVINGAFLFCIWSSLRFYVLRT
ncbi:Uncharacterized protein (Fragment) [Durusdinium trenchii]|uniref:Uncharacterized protein n=1 Tax=Durusdinium trenchii TaxID=1381693 RepID=A0ABP0JF47_9DINO